MFLITLTLIALDDFVDLGSVADLGYGIGLSESNRGQQGDGYKDSYVMQTKANHWAVHTKPIAWSR